MKPSVERRAVIILNSSERGTPAHDLAVAALAIRGAERVIDLCDNLEAQGAENVSIERLRATFGTVAAEARWRP